MDDCLKLLKGNTDEQRLVGLLLATKYVQGADKNSIVQLYSAIGIKFLNRLLKSGTQGTSHGTNEQEQAYLQLAVSILSAFCRVPDLASLDEIINKIPTFLDILQLKPTDSVVVDCLESLLGIGLASEKGLLCLQSSRGLPIVCQYLSRPAAGIDSLGSTIKLVQLLSGGNVSKEEIAESADGLFTAITVLGRELASEQGSLKFEALHLLHALCSPKILEVSFWPNQLEDGANHGLAAWLECMRLGLGQILQSRTAADQKHLALVLIESLVEVFGSMWLFGPTPLQEEAKDTAPDRFFILLVETLRVETVVLLNEVARGRFDSEYAAQCKLEESVKRQHMLATCYALLESIINVMAEKSETPSITSEILFKEAIRALNDIIGTIFEFLEEAKRHNMEKGDDLTASVRVIGRYLADAPLSYKKVFLTLLEYLFSISTESESSGFFAVQFLLPALCQVTTDVEGCLALASWDGHKKVIEYILTKIEARKESTGLIVEACDVILNLLQKENRLVDQLMPLDFLPLLSVLPQWAACQNSTFPVSLAAYICVMILDLTDEDSMLQTAPKEALSDVYGLVIKVLHYIQQAETSAEPIDDEDLWDSTISTCIGIMDQYPSLKNAIRMSTWFQQLLQDKNIPEFIFQKHSISTHVCGSQDHDHRFTIALGVGILLTPHNSSIHHCTGLCLRTVPEALQEILQFNYC